MRTLAGIDLGTQSTKIILYDPEARAVVAQASAPHPLDAREGGVREQNAADWVAAAEKCFAAFTAEQRATVAAVAVSGQQHGFVPVADDGTVLAPVKLWCDTSTAPQCDELSTPLGGPDALRAAAGNAVAPGYTASKILAFHKSRPELWDRFARVLLPHDYLNYVLTGEFTAEPGDASGTGFFDIRRRDWFAPLVDVLGIAGRLPRLLAPGEPAGRVSPAAAARFGIPAGIPVACGGGDNMMAAIGTGAVADGLVTASLGTSGTLFARASAPVLDPKGRLAAFCSSDGGWLPLLCTMNCTVATELLRRVLRRGVQEMDALAASSAPGADGVRMIPYFNGERTPDCPAGEGILLGLRSENFSEANLCRAAMESAIYGLKVGLDAFAELGVKPSVITLTGGGSKSALWRQLAADIFGTPVRVLANEEGAAFGAALQALSLVDGVPVAGLAAAHLQENPDKRAEPGPDAAKYADLFAGWWADVRKHEPLR